MLRTSVPPPLVRLLPVCCFFRYRFARVRHTPILKLKHHTKSIIAGCLLGTCGNDFPTGLAKIVLSSVIYYEILVGGKALIKGSAQVLYQHTHGLTKDEKFHTTVWIYLCITWKGGSKFLFSA